jgi:hypothetical protein
VRYSVAGTAAAQDTDLARLRPREDFQTFAAEFEAAVKP